MTVTFAQRLLEAADTRSVVAPLPGLTLADAYDDQDELVALRVARGERVIGAKVGVTSYAIQDRLGLTEPIYGTLFDRDMIAVDQPVECSRYRSARAEPEMAFIIGERLVGPGVSMHDVLDAARAVVAAVEIVDSRVDLSSGFDIANVIADNAMSAGCVVGARRVDPGAHDLSLLGCLIELDGSIVATAAGAALMGHPAVGVAALANHLGRRGRALEPGFIVLAGSLADAFSLGPGSVLSMSYAHLGSLVVRGV